MRAPAYFSQSLESIYSFRMRVSTDLQPVFKRTELKKSLRTRSKTVALHRCRQYAAAAEQVFESLRLSHFKAELTGTHATGQLGELTVPEQIDSPTIRDLEKELWKKVFNAESAIVDELPSAPEPEPESASVLSSPPVQPTSQREPLSELIRLYITEVTDQRGQDVARGIEKNLI
jgi:hypothetical protein